MKSVSFNRNTSKGFSLIELLLVLGVLAILLVAAFVVYPQVRDRNQANTEVSNLTSIKANINNLYASRGGNYAGLATETAVRARALPSSMVGGDFVAGTPTAAWGGLVNVGSAGAPGTAVAAGGRTFGIQYADVPEGVCLGLVSGAATNFSQVSVGGTDLITDNQFNPAAAATACGGTTGPKTIIFTSN